MLSDRDVAVLETAEWLEGRRVDPPSAVRARLGLHIARYTQILLHLVIQDEVLSDPRWTMLAHRIQAEAGIKARMRADRTFSRDNVTALSRAS